MMPDSGGVIATDDASRMRGVDHRPEVTENTMIWKITALVQSWFKPLRASEKYRPERHYMRGPGPKARAVATVQKSRSA